MTANLMDRSPAVVEARQASRQQLQNKTINQRIFDEIVLVDTLLFELETQGLNGALADLIAARDNILRILERGGELESKDLDEWSRARFLALQSRIEEEFDDAFDSAELVVRSRLPEIAAAGTILLMLIMGRNLPREARGLFDLRELSPFQLQAIVNARTAQKTWTQTWRRAKRDFRTAFVRKMDRAFKLGDTIGALSSTLSQLFAGALGASRIASIFRTESLRIWNRIRRIHFNRFRLNLDGLVYLATLDNRTCMRCAQYDNEAFFWDPEPDQFDILDFPALPQHPGGCRCSSAPIVKSASDLGFSEDEIDASPLLQQLTGQPPNAVNYEEWLRDQSDAVQNQVLGITRANAFRKGQVTLRDFVSITKTFRGGIAKIRTLNDLRNVFGSIVIPLPS